MGTLRERYLVDEDGQRVGVVLTMAEYERILEELEELQCLRAYDEAVAAHDVAIPLDQALREIEQER